MLHTVCVCIRQFLWQVVWISGVIAGNEARSPGRGFWDNLLHKHQREWLSTQTHTYMHTYFEVTSFFLSHTCIYLHLYDSCLCSAKPIQVWIQFNELWSSAANICVNEPALLEKSAMLCGTFDKRLKLFCSDMRYTKKIVNGWKDDRLFPLSSTSSAKLFQRDSQKTQPSHEHTFNSLSSFLWSQMFPLS